MLVSRLFYLFHFPNCFLWLYFLLYIFQPQICELWLCFKVNFNLETDYCACLLKRNTFYPIIFFKKFAVSRSPILLLTLFYAKIELCDFVLNNILH